MADEKKPIYYQDDVVKGVYFGLYTARKLPKPLYKATVKEFKKAVKKGFKATIAEFAFDSPDYEMLKALDESVHLFSGAKTFQQVLEMSDALVEGEKVLEFSEFKAVADKIFERYNVDWLKAEYNTALSTSRSAAKWVNIEKNVDKRPYLMYDAVDEIACSICKPLDGIKLPYNDPFWKINGIPQHFNCMCVLHQLDAQDLKEIGGLSDKKYVETQLEKSQKDKDPLFNFNPMQDKEIFKSTGKNKHPYFEIPKKYEEFASRNFDLPIE
jgi:hypothetical protein